MGIIKSNGRNDSTTGYNVYCRQCGAMYTGGLPSNVGANVICYGQLLSYPDKCKNCGNMLIDSNGWSVSGDSSESNTTRVDSSGKTFMTKIWHPVR